MARGRAGTCLAVWLAAAAWAASASAAIDFDGGARGSGLIDGVRASSQRLGPVPSVGREAPAGYPCRPGVVYHGGPCDPGNQPSNPAFPPAPADRPGYGDLRGYCPDPMHSEFVQAKAFAYDPSGLNYNDQDAIQWAMRYLQGHACGTLTEYKARFRELYRYAYDPSFMNRNDADSKDFAFRNAEMVPVPAVQAWKAQFRPVQEFFYQPGYLNMNSNDAATRADAWVRRGCGDVDPLKAAFKREYSFAYSPSGLNMSDRDATRYAAGKVGAMTPCYDLLR